MTNRLSGVKRYERFHNFNLLIAPFRPHHNGASLTMRRRRKSQH